VFAIFKKHPSLLFKGKARPFKCGFGPCFQMVSKVVLPRHNKLTCLPFSKHPRLTFEGKVKLSIKNGFLLFHNDVKFTHTHKRSSLLRQCVSCVNKKSFASPALVLASHVSVVFDDIASNWVMALNRQREKGIKTV
jgi:hypothetical protein